MSETKIIRAMSLVAVVVFVISFVIDDVKIYVDQRFFYDTATDIGRLVIVGAIVFSTLFCLFPFKALLFLPAIMLPLYSGNLQSVLVGIGLFWILTFCFSKKVSFDGMFFSLISSSSLLALLVFFPGANLSFFLPIIVGILALSALRNSYRNRMEVFGLVASKLDGSATSHFLLSFFLFFVCFAACLLEFTFEDLHVYLYYPLALVNHDFAMDFSDEVSFWTMLLQFSIGTQLPIASLYSAEPLNYAFASKAFNAAVWTFSFFWTCFFWLGVFQRLGMCLLKF